MLYDDIRGASTVGVSGVGSGDSAGGDGSDSGFGEGGGVGDGVHVIPRKKSFNGSWIRIGYPVELITRVRVILCRIKVHSTEIQKCLKGSHFSIIKLDLFTCIHSTHKGHPNNKTKTIASPLGLNGFYCWID